MGELRDSSAEDVNVAVELATNPAKGGGVSDWQNTSALNRALVLREVAKSIEKNLDKFATLETTDTGKPIRETRGDMAEVLNIFRFYNGMAETTLDTRMQAGRVHPIYNANYNATILEEPVGLVAAFSTSNYPLLMAAQKVVPALLVGCPAILKPSEHSSLTALQLQEVMCDAGVPEGVFQVTTGTADTGKALCMNPRVDAISFTGSTRTGEEVMKMAATGSRKVSLELGGKSSAIVMADLLDPRKCEDAAKNEDALLEWICVGSFMASGQICSATSRLLVERPVYDRVVARLYDEVLPRVLAGVGDPMEESTLMGPVTTKVQRDKLLAYEPRCTVGVEQFTKGYYVAPQIYRDLDVHSSPIWRDELFGPFVAVAPFDTLEEAVAMANDTKYGLACAVFTASDDVFNRASRAVQAGVVWRNCNQIALVDCAWGGVKLSGNGTRELGHWGLDFFLEPKQRVAAKGTSVQSPAYFA